MENIFINFLNKCDSNANGDAVIALFAAVGLCTNKPFTFGLEVVRYFLLKYKEDIHPSFNTTFILESIDFILKKTCVFDNEYFLHLRGTAIRTMFYTNLCKAKLVTP